MIPAALEELLKSVELNADNVDAHNMLGVIYLRKAHDIEQLATQAQCLKGEALKLEQEEMEKLFTKARVEFKRSVELKANFSEAWNNLAVIALHFGQREEAITAVEKALGNIIYRDSYVAHANLGQAYLEKNDYVRAQKELRQAVFEQPKFCVGRYRLAKAYYEQKEYDRAADELKEVTVDKACPIQEAFHLAGMVALRLQDRSRATEMFERCVALAPKSCLAQECKLAGARAQ
jgi:tetratricopeptide (TPR) repeat protein